MFIFQFKGKNMKALFSLITIVTINMSIAQSDVLSYLDSSELSNRFNSEVLLKYQIEYPIYRVYEFEDLLGKHELVLTERPNGNKTNDSIKAFCFLIDNDEKKIEWQLTESLSGTKRGQHGFGSTGK